jgi:hypothetical protein
MKRTLKRESKVREIGIRETIHAAPGRDAPGSTSQEAGPYGAPDPVDPLGAACTCAEGRWLRFGGCFIDLGPRQALPQVSPFGEAGTNGPEPSLRRARRSRVPSSTLQREPTRLETRTKECNYDASHWVANPKAQRK